MTSFQLGHVASWLVIESEQREGDDSGPLTIISWNETIEAHRREVRDVILDTTARPAPVATYTVVAVGTIALVLSWAVGLGTQAQPDRVRRDREYISAQTRQGRTSPQATKPSLGQPKTSEPRRAGLSLALL